MCYLSCPVAASPFLRSTQPESGALPPDGLAWEQRLDRLRALLRGLGRVIVAYSGGVDSSLLLRVAHEVLGHEALGVIGASDSYAARELELARAQAASFGARLEVVKTGELADPEFRSNPARRCYHCKSELYRQLEAVARREGAAVLDGTIVEETITHAAGGETEQAVARDELVRLVKDAGREPVERDTLYRPVERTEATFTVLV